ncbi:MAG: hypothetical protein JWN44_874 [Myxococcales bacterium]|nr:hypothetical protein [Myxococcales bacterium]
MIYFAFPDAAIGYDCVTCGSRCCKGLGFALSGHELVPLLTRRPGFAPFLQMQRELVHAFDLDDGCWALGSDGRCEVEVEHGRAAKPSTCRLFPVNRLMTFGEHLVVDLHLADCPLVDAATGPRTIIRWQDDAGDLDDVDAIGTTPTLPAGTPDDWLAREAAVRDAAGACRPARVGELLSAEAGALLATWRRWFGVGDDEAAVLEAEVAPLFRLVLPSLRMQLLTLPGPPPYPRLMRAIDSHMAGVAWLAMLSRRAGRAPSLRGIAELFRWLPLLRELLVRWNTHVRLFEGAAPASAPPEVAAAWRALTELAATEPIGEALEATTLPPSLRPLLLRLASDRMR